MMNYRIACNNLHKTKGSSYNRTAWRIAILKTMLSPAACFFMYLLLSKEMLSLQTQEVIMRALLTPNTIK